LIECRWLKRVTEDLAVARNELHRIQWASAFHSQQATGKALKTLLVAIGVQPPKTHEINIY